MMNEQYQDQDDYITCSALITYAGYMAHNHYRTHGSASTERAKEAIGQYIIQGVRGHARAAAFLDSRWARPIGHLI